jgi:hypothetical protein
MDSLGKQLSFYSLCIIGKKMFLRLNLTGIFRSTLRAFLQTAVE